MGISLDVQNEVIGAELNLFYLTNRLNVACHRRLVAGFLFHKYRFAAIGL
jgi:hypothetical protein